MPKLNGLPIALLSLATAATLVSSPALAEEKYGPGVTDAEIKLGQTMPYSGPLSAYATIGRAEAAYIAMVNDQGGINGRKIKLISLDDSFSPPRDRRADARTDRAGGGVCHLRQPGYGHQHRNPEVPQRKESSPAVHCLRGVEVGPQRFLAIIASSIETVLKPAGLDIAKGIFSVGYAKDITDPGLQGDPGIKAYRQWMARYYPDGNPSEVLNAYGYSVAMTMVQVLRQCGEDLTRENLMRQAAGLKDLELPLAMPGVRLNTSATDYYPIEQFQMTRFDGERWVKFGEVIVSH